MGMNGIDDNKIKSVKKSFRYFCLGLKYLFPIVMVVLSYSRLHTKRYIFVVVLELIIIELISDAILKKKRLLGLIFNDLLVLLINIQLIVLYFGNSYITFMMLKSLDSLEDLSGRTFQYGFGVLAVILFSFIPIVELPLKKEANYRGCIFTLIIELFITMIYSSDYSPLYGYIDIYIQKTEHEKKVAELLKAGEKTHLFYDERVDDGIDKPSSLSPRPNVVLIFTEGISQNIIEDERNITPNLSDFQDKSITFDNYYNHTFATYRGLIGQLYSGYQLDDYDLNTLVSVQSIMKHKGYRTCMINTEPNNKEFTDYLNSLGFDTVIGELENYEGKANSMSDRQAFEVLSDVINDYSKSDEPFFIVIYTFGTHASLDSTNEKYGDGKDNLLNRFYNLDYQFGLFFSDFEESDACDNTVLFFTGDHCTYADQDFSESFPEYNRTFHALDRIPLSIWYKGVDPIKIYAGGRNSLDLAPTILDFIDISDDNYFLGNSLFSEDSTYYDTIFESLGSIYSTNDGVIRKLEGDEYIEYSNNIADYFAAKTQEPLWE